MSDAVDRPANPLLNGRTDEGLLICHDCERPIHLNDGVKFCEKYAVHIRCPKYDSDVR